LIVDIGDRELGSRFDGRGAYPRELKRTKDTGLSAKLCGWKTRTRRAMLALVARPLALRRAAIWNFFLNVVLIEYTLASFNFSVTRSKSNALTGR